jgi:hypothetical protein
MNGEIVFSHRGTEHTEVTQSTTIVLLCVVSVCSVPLCETTIHPPHGRVR